MREFVTDAHPLIWRLTNDAHLSRRCQRIFAQADVGQSTIYVPAVVLVEVIYLVEKQRLPEKLIDQIFALLEPSATNYRLVGLDRSIVEPRLGYRSGGKVGSDLVRKSRKIYLQRGGSAFAAKIL